VGPPLAGPNPVRYLLTVPARHHGDAGQPAVLLFKSRSGQNPWLQWLLHRSKQPAHAAEDRSAPTHHPASPRINITVVNRGGLEKAACECYRTIRDRQAVLITAVN